MLKVVGLLPLDLLLLLLLSLPFSFMEASLIDGGVIGSLLKFLTLFHKLLSLGDAGSVS